MSTLKATNLQHASAAAPAIVLASTGSATAQLSSINDGPIAGARNRIINGDMRIDQRNAGASVTPASSGYTLDRVNAILSQASKYSVQRNAGGVTPPAGFTNYLGITSTSAYSVLAGDFFAVAQYIEGLNAADLAFGTASASPVTLSFWVRSSLTGVFGGSLQNSAQNRCYPFSYTISAANTWEQKTITIAGDTTGTWLTDTGRGIGVIFGLGVGSTLSGTAGAWTSSQIFVPTGATSVVGTNGATFYITGVQLEPGSVATPFERRSYGQELALCQRYCLRYDASQEGYTRYAVGECPSTVQAETFVYAPVEMRTRPSLTTTGTASNYALFSAGSVLSCTTLPSVAATSTGKTFHIPVQVASGLTAGRAAQLISNNNTTSYLIFTAEL